MSLKSYLLPQETCSRWQMNVCSLNFLLSIMGYLLAMALLSPLGTDIEAGSNVYFTYPFRAFQLAVALLAFWSVRSRLTPQMTWKIGLLTIFWGFYLLRAFWDLVVSPPYNSSFAWAFSPGKELYFICYVVIDFIPLFAIFKGWDCIDFQRVLKWILILGGIGLFFTLLTLRTHLDHSWTGDIGGSGRFAATRMLHTQALGYFACDMAIISLWTFFNCRRLFWRVFSVIIVLLAFYMMLKAGSRGPILGLAVVVCAWFSFRNKNFVFAILAGVFVVGLVFLFQDQFLSLIKEVSPTMEERLRITLEHGDTSGREVLWAEYWSETLRNPIFGFQLDRLGSPHSMILDGFMMFGLIAGGLVTVLIGMGCTECVKALRARVPNSWWVLLLLMLFTQSFTGGQFSSVALQAPLLLLFIWDGLQRNGVLGWDIK